MKRILALLISLMMVFALVACNNTEDPDNSGGGEIKVKEKPPIEEAAATLDEVIPQG